MSLTILSSLTIFHNHNISSVNVVNYFKKKNSHTNVLLQTSLRVIKLARLALA